MSRVIDEVVKLNLPEGEYVVIGSGLLDALELRPAGDIDLAVSPRLFEVFAGSGDFIQSQRYGADVLTGATSDTEHLEIWKQWQDDIPFFELIKNTVKVDGVTFAHPLTIIDRKQLRGQDKDLKDIALLKKHYDYK